MKKAIVTIRRATPADNGLLAEIGARAFADTVAADNAKKSSCSAR
jgi:hypothetical protein